LLESGPLAKLRVVAQALYGVALSLIAAAPVVVLVALAVVYGRGLVPSWSRLGLTGTAWPLGVWVVALLLLPLVQRGGRGRPPTGGYKALQTVYEWLCFAGFAA